MESVFLPVVILAVCVMIGLPYVVWIEKQLPQPQLGSRRETRKRDTSERLSLAVLFSLLAISASMYLAIYADRGIAAVQIALGCVGVCWLIAGLFRAMEWYDQRLNADPVAAREMVNIIGSGALDL